MVGCVIGATGVVDVSGMTGVVDVSGDRIAGACGGVAIATRNAKHGAVSYDRELLLLQSVLAVEHINES